MEEDKYYVLYKELNSISTGCPLKFYQYEMVTGGIMESILPFHFKLVNSRGTFSILCILHTAYKYITMREAIHPLSG